MTDQDDPDELAALHLRLLATLRARAHRHVVLEHLRQPPSVLARKPAWCDRCGLRDDQVGELYDYRYRTFMRVHAECLTWTPRCTVCLSVPGAHSSRGCACSSGFSASCLHGNHYACRRVRRDCACSCHSGPPDADAGTRDQRRQFTAAQRSIIRELAGRRCQSCGDALDDRWEADHVVPWISGGRTEVENGQALCARCHRRKTRRTPLSKAARERLEQRLERRARLARWNV
jgi:5-methylcytosine-specific restriction endonuclease McrA